MNDNNTNDHGAFVNFSNHPSSTWDDAQISSALEYGGKIVDIPFPPVDPEAKREDIAELAEKMTDEILHLYPSAVMCQGEFGLCYSVIRRLRALGLTVLHACSVRNVHTDGNVKTIRFDFVQFREYE